MPIRKKIFRLLRNISGTTQPSKTVARSGSTKPKSTAYTETSLTVTPAQQSQKTITPKTEKSAELVLYGRPSCPYCARVDRVIKELNIEDKLTRRRTSYGSEWRTDLQERTGSTQVPCLFINGEPMFESLDIIDWMRSHFT